MPLTTTSRLSPRQIIEVGPRAVEGSPRPVDTKVILITTTVVGTVAIAAVVLLVFFNRRKQRQFREARKADPYLTRTDFARRQKMNSVEQSEEHDRQRAIMIRKSLASRTSTVQGESSTDIRLSMSPTIASVTQPLGALTPGPSTFNRPNAISWGSEPESQFGSQLDIPRSALSRSPSPTPSHNGLLSPEQALASRLPVERSRKSQEDPS